MRPSSPLAQTAVLPEARPVTPMSILAATLQDLGRELAATGGVSSHAADLLRYATELSAGLDPYLAQCTTPESPDLTRLADRTRAHDWAGAHDTSRDHSAHGALEQEMLSGHVEGQTLKFLVRATRATRILEIGMFTGYSALAMAEALPDNGVLVACEVDARAAEFARDCFRDAPSATKIDVRVGPALQTLAALSEQRQVFDLVFIDADKAGYLDYLSVLLDTTLLAPHGVICVDNTLMQGQPYLSGRPTANGEAIRAFNRAVAADERVEQVVLPVRDGLTLIHRARRATVPDPGRG